MINPNQTSPWPGRLWLFGTVAILLLTAPLFFQAVMQTLIDNPIRGDARDYVGYAFNLKIHGIYSRSWPESFTELPIPDALRAPGYPWLLSLFVDAGEMTFNTANLLLFQALLGVLTVFFYLLIYRKFMSTRWALAAGLLTAISPHLINASVYVLTEAIFTCLLGAHLLLLERALRLQRNGLFFGAGLLLALSFLVRPTTQYLMAVYLTWGMLWFRNTREIHWKPLLYLIFPVLIATSAWSMRNFVQMGQFSDSTLTANFLQHGMYINMMYEGRLESYGYPYRFDPMNAALAGNTGKILAAIGDRFLEDPRRYLAWYLIGKPIQFFSWNLTESIGDAFVYAPTYSPYFDKSLFQITHDLAKAVHSWLMFLAVMGAFWTVGKAKTQPLPVVLLAVVLLYFMALHMIGAPFPRYSVPIRPICYGLALFTLQEMTRWIAAAARRR